MIPFRIEEEALPFRNLDYIFVPEVLDAVREGRRDVQAYLVDTEAGELKPFMLKLDDMTAEEKEIIAKGCLINYNKPE